MSISLKAEYHASIYFVALVLMVISLPLSRFGLSVAQFALLGNWLWEMDFKRKIRDIFSNKILLIVASIYLMHLLGLIYTTDFQYALKDLRIKLPLIALPVIFASTKQIEMKKVNTLLFLHIGAVLVASFISFGILLARNISDIRDISPFISHIRLSLNVCLAIFFLVYFIFFVHKDSWKIPVGLVFVALWLVVFLFAIESVTGIFVLIANMLFLLIYGMINFKNKYYKLSLGLVFIGIPLFSMMYLNDVARSYYTPYKNDLKSIETKTAMGNPYLHDTIRQPIENGSYIGLYVCEPELREAWNSRSNLNYDSLDKKGQGVKYTLRRFLNSKGLRKDAGGVSQLSEKEIHEIENGIANVNYTRKVSINSRIYKILWEYYVFSKGGNPGGHSLIQRFEYWRISLQIIRQNIWFGVGTGDIPDAYRIQYEESGSILAPEFRHRAHNQYLAIFVTFGIIGLCWFIFSVYYPPLKLHLYNDFLYFVFIITLSVSMLVEDTLETQMGVTLFAFFNAFFLFVKPVGKS
ncbi:MAG: O-antigen ligase family protein [Bacteroidales bacterium]|nr:O-antigen ligase family protein [Bacteroidales bacterium]